MADDTPDHVLLDILARTKTIATIGVSLKPERPSHYVSRFMQDNGRRVIPVNPGLAGQSVIGEMAVATLADLPGNAKIDMVNVFRRSETIPDVVDEILAIDWPTKPVIWLQLDIRHDGAADRAREAGFTVVQDRCLKIEYPRLRPDDVTVA